MLTIPKNHTKQNRDSVALTTSSDYIKIFSIPCRSACNFNLSGQVSGRDWSIAGTLTAGWNEAGITATMSAVGKGTEGVYAIRASQASNGADIDLWIVFNGNVSGTLTLDTTVTSANAQGSMTFHNLVHATAVSGNGKGTIEFYTGNDYTVWGTSGTTI